MRVNVPALLCILGVCAFLYDFLSRAIGPTRRAISTTCSILIWLAVGVLFVVAYIPARLLDWMEEE